MPTIVLLSTVIVPSASTFKVIDKETGKTVDEWVSEKGKTHDFGPKLEAGKSYILRETVAPAGYKYATDIEFTVKKDGTIETNAKTTTGSARV